MDMIDSIVMELMNKGQQRASASATVNGIRYKGLHLYENGKGELDLYTPYNSKFSRLPSTVRQEVRRALTAFYDQSRIF
jgi:hypothetical protein